MERFRRRRQSSGPSRAVWIVGVLVILGAGGAWFWLQSRDSDEASVGREDVADTSAIRTGPTEPLEDLPELDASDELVRRMAAGLSSHPGLAEWLVTDDLVRRFVGAVVRVAAGRSPREPLEFMDPEGDFRVREPGDTAVVAPDSYRRYDPVAATFGSLDTRGTAELYGRLRPLFQEAYRDLGFTNEPFEVMLARAVETLLAVPVPEGPVEVMPDGAEAWEYRDPELEELKPAQKHLLRMGPENIRRIQSKLRGLAEALDLPEVPRRESGDFPS